ncbi:vacuolar fusion protein CCZ1 homolog [Ixodes scapularis]
MTTKTQVYLQNFFIYNPTYGQKEDEEHKKIIYYYPENAEQDVKLRNVGLCEALVSFTQTFSPSTPCEVLHTQRTRQFFLQPEENFWMVMTVGLPTQQKTRNGQLYVEHLSEDIQDNVYQAVLEAVYKAFRMFVGSLSDLLSDKSNKEVIRDYFDKHVPRLRLQHADILDIFRGIQFLPLDKHSFLKVQCFINHLESRFRQLKYSVFLCNDLLVWSGLDQGDMQVLYQYLVHSVLQTAVESELLPGFSLSPRQSASTSQSRFLYGPVDDEATLSRIQRVYIAADCTADCDRTADREQCYLLVFRAYSATLCLLVRATGDDMTQPFLKELDAYLASELTALANDIGKHCTKLSGLSSMDQQSKYIYFNRMNLAQKSTVHSERRAGIVVPSELVRFLADINEDLAQVEEAGELVAKTTSEWWVVGKFSDQREFYVILNQKSANIIQISGEFARPKPFLRGRFAHLFIESIHSSS